MLQSPMVQFCNEHIMREKGSSVNEFSFIQLGSAAILHLCLLLLPEIITAEHSLHCLLCDPLRMTSQKKSCYMVIIILRQIVSRRQTMKATKTIYHLPSINAMRLVTQVPVVCFHVTLTVRYCLTSGSHPVSRPLVFDPEREVRRCHCFRRAC